MADEQAQSGEELVQHRPFSSREAIERALAQLLNFIGSIRRLSAIITLAALLSLAALTVRVLAGLLIPPRTDARPETFLMTLTISALILPNLGLLLLYYWEQKVGLGMILFDEISDEVEWGHRTHRNVRGKQQKNGVSNPAEADPTMKGGDRPNLDERIVLRRFLRESTLPFARAGKGAGLYALFFTICLFISICIAVFRTEF